MEVLTWCNTGVFDAVDGDKQQDVTNLFWFDVLRGREDVGVRRALKDPVQSFQLLLSESIGPQVLP